MQPSPFGVLIVKMLEYGYYVNHSRKGVLQVTIDGRNTVKPLRDRKVIRRVKDALLADKKYKYYALFTLGINTGLRISDLLSLKWEDILNSRGKITDRIILFEKKTRKRAEIPLNKTVQGALSLYWKHTVSQTYVFAAENDKVNNKEKPVSRQYVYKILREYIVDRAGFTEAVGTHTMRKTFGYQAYVDGWDIYRIQECLNHSSPSITRRYIDLSQEDKDSVYLKIDL